MHPKQTKGKDGSNPKLSLHDEKSIIRSLHYIRKQDGNFTSKRIRLYSGVSSVHNRTVSRALNKYGYHYQQASRKGLLTENDLKLHMKFAKDIKKYYDDGLWSSRISFYVDAENFIHKTNPMDQTKAPKSLVWRKKNEGLAKGCTSKRNKAGHCRKMASFFCCYITRYEVCYCKHYERFSGKLFAEFIENNFLEIFKNRCNTTRNVFVQDGDPSQNFKAAKTALNKIGAVQFSIPPRSPDLNPIENVFNLVEKTLSSVAVKSPVSKESYAKFVE